MARIRSLFLLPVLAILAPVCLHARDALVTDSRLRVRIRGPQGECRAVRQLVRRCLDVMADFLELRKGPTTWLDVRIVAPAVPVARDRSNSNPDLALPADLTPLQAVQEINLALLDRLARTHRKPGRDRLQPTTVHWLAAALTFEALKVRNRPDGLVLPPDTTPAFLVFEQDSYPDVRVLLSKPVSTEWPLCYTLYALHCHLLARCIRLGDRSNPSRLSRILELQYRGRQPADAVQFVLADALRPGEDLQSWYRRRVRPLARVGTTRTALPALTRRVQELTSVPVLAAGDNGAFGHTRVPLERLVGRLRDYKLNSQAIRALDDGFQELLMRAPVIFQPSLKQYIRAIQKMAKGRTWGVRRELRNAAKAFAAAVERQRRINTYLDEVAVRALPPEVRLAADFEALRPIPGRARGRSRELDRYLDALARSVQTPEHID
ncbi:MAG: hypothetical protein GXP31_08990 [Kiritimatiellaeota bacterium]|nr:hypothetical protein [Kiritimatiellota bacterium]